MRDGANNAYSDFKGKEAEIKKINEWKLIKNNINDGMQGEKFALIYKKVSQGKTNLMVAFRGTEPTFYDITTDLDADKVNYIPFDKNRYNKLKSECDIESNELIHTGFASVYYGAMRTSSSLAEKVTSIIKSECQNNQIDNLYITGHSLGGALAHIFCYDLMASIPEIEQIKKISLISWASPKIGDNVLSENVSKLKAHYQDKVSLLRIFDSKDPVPMLPLDSFGFEHWSQEEMKIIDSKTPFPLKDFILAISTGDVEREIEFVNHALKYAVEHLPIDPRCHKLSHYLEQLNSFFPVPTLNS